MDWKGKLQYQWPMVVCTPLPPERSGAPRYCHASGNCAALSRLVTTRYNFIMFCSPPSLLRHVHWLLCRVIKTSLFLGKVFTDCRLLILKHQTSKSMKVYHEVLSLWWKFPGSVKVETKELCSLHPVVTRSSDPWPWVSREREKRNGWYHEPDHHDTATDICQPFHHHKTKRVEETSWQSYWEQSCPVNDNLERILNRWNKCETSSTWSFIDFISILIDSFLNSES